MSDKRLTEYSVNDFLELIDAKFEENVGKIKRIDVSWGIWSREMNVEIRRRIEEEKNGKTVLGMVFTYWILVSEILDLVYDCKGWRALLIERKLKGKVDEALGMRKRILEYE